MITNNITWTELESIVSPPPWNAGAKTQAIPHKDVAIALVSSFTMVHAVRIALSKDKRNLAISISMPDPSYELVPTIGLVHSNTGHKAMRFYAGVTTPNQSFALVRLPFSLRKKRGIDLKEVIKDNTKRLFTPFTKKLPKLVAQYQNKKIPLTLAHSLMLQTVREGILPKTRISRVEQEYSLLDRTLWDLMCAFSSAVKKSPPVLQMDQMSRIVALLTRSKDNTGE